MSWVSKGSLRVSKSNTMNMMMIVMSPVKGGPQLVPLSHHLTSLWQAAGVDQTLPGGVGGLVNFL